MPPNQNAQVLIVDDEPGIRLVVSGLLTQLGYQPQQADSARAATDAMADIESFLVVERIEREVAAFLLRVPVGAANLSPEGDTWCGGAACGT